MRSRLDAGAGSPLVWAPGAGQRTLDARYALRQGLQVAGAARLTQRLRGHAGSGASGGYLRVTCRYR